jgi:hypothetical protein
MASRFNDDFDPILLEGHTAQLLGSGLPGGGMGVRCLSVGSLPEWSSNFGALTAGVWDEDNADTNLIMPKMTLAVLRMKIVTNMKMRLKNPSSVRYWRSRDAAFYLPQFPWSGSDWEKRYSWRQSELMVWEDESPPAFDLYSTVAQATSIVLFSGWRFALERLPSDQKGAVNIWVNDWPSARGK